MYMVVGVGVGVGACLRTKRILRQASYYINLRNKIRFAESRQVAQHVYSFSALYWWASGAFSDSAS